MNNKDELVKQKTNLLGDIEKEKETLQDIINRYNELTEQKKYFRRRFTSIQM